jgi:hypothetical protein
MAGSTAALVNQDKLQTLLNKKVDLSKADRDQLKEEFGDMKHELQHLNNPQDEAPWKILAKKSPDDYSGFKLFPSDRCLLIARVEGKEASAQWVRDPIRIAGNNNADSTNEHDAVMRTDSDRLAALPLPANVATLLMSAAMSGLLERGGEGPMANPVQAGSGCVYPHPGTPQETWGAYINKVSAADYTRLWRRLQAYVIRTAPGPLGSPAPLDPSIPCPIPGVRVGAGVGS